MNTYLYVLNFNSGICTQYTLTPEHEAMETEALFAALFINIDDCHYMYSSDEMNHENSADYND